MQYPYWSNLKTGRGGIRHFYTGPHMSPCGQTTRVGEGRCKSVEQPLKACKRCVRFLNQ